MGCPPARLTGCCRPFEPPPVSPTSPNLPSRCAPGDGEPLATGKVNPSRFLPANGEGVPTPQRAVATTVVHPSRRSLEQPAVPVLTHSSE